MDTLHNCWFTLSNSLVSQFLEALLKVLLDLVWTKSVSVWTNVFDCEDNVWKGHLELGWDLRLSFLCLKKEVLLLISFSSQILDVRSLEFFILCLRCLWCELFIALACPLALRSTLGAVSSRPVSVWASSCNLPLVLWQVLLECFDS